MVEKIEESLRIIELFQDGFLSEDEFYSLIDGGFVDANVLQEVASLEESEVSNEALVEGIVSRWWNKRKAAKYQKRADIADADFMASASSIAAANAHKYSHLANKSLDKLAHEYQAKADAHKLKGDSLYRRWRANKNEEKANFYKSMADMNRSKMDNMLTRRR